MYTPPHFRSSAPWQELMRRHAFGLLITGKGDELWTTHLPYLVSDDGEAVRMHMARANPHWKAIEQQPRCRFVVQGEHAYVSPEWYDTPESVPTWNYEAVHVEGRAELSFDEDALWQLLGEMAARFEEPDAAWKLDRLSEAFRKPRLKNIVGVTLIVERGEAKQKLSQNRSAAERRRVAEELRRRGDGRLADVIEALPSD